jgi:hypothetical protein
MDESGFAKFHVEPHLPEGVESFEVSYETSNGKNIRVRAWREDGKPKFSIE